MNNDRPTETAEITLPMDWRQPYSDLDVYRLHVGPFYAGEVARTVSDGWKASSPISPRILSHPTKEAAQRDIESVVRNQNRASHTGKCKDGYP